MEHLRRSELFHLFHENTPNSTLFGTVFGGTIFGTIWNFAGQSVPKLFHRCSSSKSATLFHTTTVL